MLARGWRRDAKRYMYFGLRQSGGSPVKNVTHQKPTKHHQRTNKTHLAEPTIFHMLVSHGFLMVANETNKPCLMVRLSVAIKNQQTLDCTPTRCHQRPTNTDGLFDGFFDGNGSVIGDANVAINAAINADVNADGDADVEVHICADVGAGVDADVLPRTAPASALMVPPMAMPLSAPMSAPIASLPF